MIWTSRPLHLTQVKRRTIAMSGKYKISGRPACSNVIFDECRQLACEHVTLNSWTPIFFSLAIVGGGIAL